MDCDRGHRFRPAKIRRACEKFRRTVKKDDKISDMMLINSRHDDLKFRRDPDYV